MGESGRRERKRRQTRDRIVEAARSQFAERGFDGVTVAEIAETADVSEQTVYNHFATKEDLVLWRRGIFEADLLVAIRDRPAGEGVLAAFHRFVVGPRGDARHERPAGAAAGQPTTAALPASTVVDEGRLIMDSPALRARERSIVADHVASLAALLAEETGADADDIEPWVAAAAMFGAAQALIDFARRRVIEGARPPGLTSELRRRADRAVEMLGRGMSDYAIKRER